MDFLAAIILVLGSLFLANPIKGVFVEYKKAEAAIEYCKLSSDSIEKYKSCVDGVK